MNPLTSSLVPPEPIRNESVDREWKREEEKEREKWFNTTWGKKRKKERERKEKRSTRGEPRTNIVSSFLHYADWIWLVTVGVFNGALLSFRAPEFSPRYHLRLLLLCLPFNSSLLSSRRIFVRSCSTSKTDRHPAITKVLSLFPWSSFPPGAYQSHGIIEKFWWSFKLGYIYITRLMLVVYAFPYWERGMREKG